LSPGRRGLRGVKLVVSDAHEGIKAAVSRIFTATWQRCRVGSLKKSAAMRTSAPFEPSCYTANIFEPGCVLLISAEV
jgi:hypothetical protein